MAFKYQPAQNYQQWRGAGPDTAERLRNCGVDLGEEFAALEHRWQVLRSRHESLPTEVELREDVLNKLLAKPDAKIDVTAETMRPVVSNLLLQVTDYAAADLTAWLEDHADALLGELRKTTFDPALAVLERAAASPYRNAGEALAAKATEDAEALATAPIAAETLTACYMLRRSLYRGVTFHQETRTGVFRNPEAANVDVLYQHSGAEYWLSAIRDYGAQVWLPTYSEALQADDEPLGSRIRRTRTGKREKPNTTPSVSACVKRGRSALMPSEANEMLEHTTASLDGVAYARVQEALARGCDEVELEEIGLSPHLARRLARLAWRENDEWET